MKIYLLSLLANELFMQEKQKKEAAAASGKGVKQSAGELRLQKGEAINKLLNLLFLDYIHARLHLSPERLAPSHLKSVLRHTTCTKNL